MKFLSKNNQSTIFLHGEIYVVGRDNSVLRLRLLDEQFNFCAYTEKYIEHGIDSTDVEHFDPSKKGNDNYFNYYTTLRSANERKSSKYEMYSASNFFNTLFFQNREQFNERIVYDDFTYNARDENDQDAKNFIDYLGLNDDYLYTARIYHIRRLKETLGGLTNDEILHYFRRHSNDLSYVTAIEEAFEIDLANVIEDL
jgi:hypothetical protein